jgi:dolichol-phosphate mannosyltransferase
MSSIAIAGEASAAVHEERAHAAIPLGWTPSAPTVFVIPAFNEEDNLPRLFFDLEARPHLFPVGSCVIVVDDGSADGTPALVEAYSGPLPVQLVRLPENQGPGAAFRAGFAAALEHAEDEAFIVTLEADTTGDIDSLPAMLERAAAGAELVLAQWRMVNVSLKRRLLSAGAGFVVRHALGLQAHTVSSFYRVYRAGSLRAASDRYGEDLIREPGFACKAEILAKLIHLGARVEEVPVDLDCGKRVGKSKMPIFRTFAAYWRMMARQRRMAAPETPA